MIKAVVTDIEGTTTALSFVKEVLFPYARDQLPAFVRSHGQDPRVRDLLNEARREAGADLDDKALIAQFLAWIDQDLKITPLKSLQGLIWEKGYQQGDFVGHVYEDAALKLKSWHQRGIKLYVYSSGSVRAQELLFGYSELGDMSEFFSGYFDTHTGPKQDSASYRRIAAQISLEPAEIVFLSDTEAELDAARAAGFETVQLVREGRSAVAGQHPQVRDFRHIAL